MRRKGELWGMRTECANVGPRWQSNSAPAYGRRSTFLTFDEPIKSQLDREAPCQGRPLGPSLPHKRGTTVERLDDQEPIVSLRTWGSGPRPEGTEARDAGGPRPGPIAFDRRELSIILSVYGRLVAAGEWRDYALDFGRERAVFSIFRRASEMPLYRIVDRKSTRLNSSHT